MSKRGRNSGNVLMHVLLIQRTITKSLLQPPAGEPVQDVKLERNENLLWYYAAGDWSIYEYDDLKCLPD